MTAGRSYAYSYNSVDELTHQTDDSRMPSISADDEQVTYTYTPAGLLNQRTLFKANGSGGWTQEQSTARTYYDNRLAKGLTTYNGSNAVVEQHSLGYLDANGIYVDGNRTSDTFTRADPAGQTAACSTSSCTQTWRYDARDRLAYENDGAGNGIEYTLDVANRCLRDVRHGRETLRPWGREVPSAGRVRRCSRQPRACERPADGVAVCARRR